MSLLDTMKRIAVQTYEASDPAAVLFGTVTKASPLSVRVDNRFDLPADMLIQLRNPVTVEAPSFSAGDKLALLRNHGGQAYLILGKV